MAGFFGFFNYEKEGPGIAKDAPRKKTFVVFFETFSRNIWKFMTTNLVYCLLSLPLVTHGLACVGITNVTRNTARDKHSFGLSDFFETIGKNWKHALPAGILNLLVYAVLLFNISFFVQTKGWMGVIGLGITLYILFMFHVMNYYTWTLMITFRFRLKQIYKNSFKFVFINFKRNLIVFFSVLLVYAINALLFYLLMSYWAVVFFIEMLLYVLLFPGFRFLLVQYCTFPAIRKYIIDPYYAEHPNEDIEQRKNLGIEVETAPKGSNSGSEEGSDENPDENADDDDDIVFTD